jgi:hypothetical protein
MKVSSQMTLIKIVLHLTSPSSSALNLGRETTSLSDQIFAQVAAICKSVSCLRLALLDNNDHYLYLNKNIFVQDSTRK